MTSFLYTASAVLSFASIIFQIVCSFIVVGSFGEFEDYTKEGGGYTEKYVELTHVDGNTWRAENKETYHSYETSRFGGAWLLILIGLFLTCPIWVFFYYVWVKKCSAKACRKYCPEGMLENFDRELKRVIEQK